VLGRIKRRGISESELLTALVSAFLQLDIYHGGSSSIKGHMTWDSLLT
jgi:hypothetical protein